MQKYILYCGQEANFATRSMLIPYYALTKCPKLQDRLNVLRKYAKSYTFKIDGKKYHIPQLVLQNVTWAGGYGSHDITE